MLFCCLGFLFLVLQVTCYVSLGGKKTQLTHFLFNLSAWIVCPLAMNFLNCFFFFYKRAQWSLNLGLSLWIIFCCNYIWNSPSGGFRWLMLLRGEDTHCSHFSTTLSSVGRETVCSWALVVLSCSTVVTEPPVGDTAKFAGIWCSNWCPVIVGHFFLRPWLDWR